MRYVCRNLSFISVQLPPWAGSHSAVYTRYIVIQRFPEMSFGFSAQIDEKTASCLRNEGLELRDWSVPFDLSSETN